MSNIYDFKEQSRMIASLIKKLGNWYLFPVPSING